MFPTASPERVAAAHAVFVRSPWPYHRVREGIDLHRETTVEHLNEAKLYEMIRTGRDMLPDARQLAARQQAAIRVASEAAERERAAAELVEVLATIRRMPPPELTRRQREVAARFDGTQIGTRWRTADPLACPILARLIVAADRPPAAAASPDRAAAARTTKGGRR